MTEISLSTGIPGSRYDAEKKKKWTKNLIRGAKIFHFGTLSSTHEGVREATRYAIDVAKEAGCIVSFDPNLRPPLWKSLDEAKAEIEYGLSKCDILKISDNEIQWLTGKNDYTEAVNGSGRNMISRLSWYLWEKKAVELIIRTGWLKKRLL